VKTTHDAPKHDERRHDPRLQRDGAFFDLPPQVRDRVRRSERASS
jgi:hypothetical protein